MINKIKLGTGKTIEVLALSEFSKEMFGSWTDYTEMVKAQSSCVLFRHQFVS